MERQLESKTPRPWFALGLASGILSAVILGIAEWFRVRGLDHGQLEGLSEHVVFLITATTVFGVVTVPLGFGFGLSLSGFQRWLGLPQNWIRLSRDEDYRERHEGNVAGLILYGCCALALVCVGTFAIQRLFVHHMNNPTLGAAFMAIGVAAILTISLAFTGAGVVVCRGIAARLGFRMLSRREPRLLRGLIGFVAVGGLAVTGAVFVVFRDPEVWPLSWVAFLAFTIFLPVMLVLAGPVISWARVLRHPAVIASVIAVYSILSLWSFSALGGREGPRIALLEDAIFTPTLAGVIHRLADRDGDGQASLLGGSDCDDSNPEVYAGAPEIPGNGVDDNCIGGDAEIAVAPEPVEPDSLPSQEPDPVVEAPVQRNIVIILVDTLRPDHLGFFGYERDLSPRMDALARESVVFDRVYAQAPHTPRSIPSIFTSRYASHIDFERPRSNYPVLREDNETFFEQLDEVGYYNLAVSSHYYFEPERGMAQGFDEWDNRGATSISETNTAIVAPEILANLEEHIPDLVASESPFCLFVHYFEPHSRWMWHPDQVDFERGPRGRQRHINNYDSEIAFVDDYVGATLDMLSENGLLDDAIVVLTSDHGEGFNEHGHYFHGQTVYDEVIRVPLMIKLPDQEPQRIPVPVSLLDVGPTILELVGAPIPESFEGRALFSQLDELAPVDIFSELLPYSNYNEHLLALVAGNEKLIYNVGSRRYELFDLAADPGEQDSIHRDAERRAPLQERLLGWMER